MAGQSFNWAFPVYDDIIANGRPNRGSCLSTDAEGNTYITGSFIQPVDFDPGPATAILQHIVPSTNDSLILSVYLAKYSPSGAYLWAKVVTSAIVESSVAEIGSILERGVTVDRHGNVAVTGTYSGKVYFNAGKDSEHAPANRTDLFIARFDEKGNYRWMKTIKAMEDGASIAVNGNIVADGRGDLYISGLYNGSFDVDPGQGVTPLKDTSDSRNFFMAKYDVEGSFIWAKSIKSSARVAIGEPRLAVDTANGINDVYLTGAFTDTMDFDEGSGRGVLASQGSLSDAFIAKYDRDGLFAWVKGIGGTGIEEGWDLSVCRSGDIAVSGYFMNTVDFDPGPDTFMLTANGMLDAFVVKYDKNGHLIWARNIGGMGTMVQPEYLTVDMLDNIYLSGLIGIGGSEVDFNLASSSALIRVGGLMDGFVSKYDACGNYIWAGGIGSDDRSTRTRIVGMTVNPLGEVVVAGEFDTLVDANPLAGFFPLVADARTGGTFIAKLTLNDTPATIKPLRIVACGNSYTLNGKEYTQSGVYTQLLPGITRCDSIVLLDLTLGQKAEKPNILIDNFTLRVDGVYAGYLWLMNGLPIEGARADTYAVRTNGMYQVVVINDAGCADTSDGYRIDNYTGIKGHTALAEQIYIYPNPTHDMVYINAPFTMQVHLTDIAGKMVKEKKRTSFMSTSDLAEGIYLLNILDESGRLIKVEKLLKTH